MLNVQLETNNTDAPFRYVCFISYRWSPEDNKERTEQLISFLVGKIKEELAFSAAWSDVYWDQRVMMPGYDVDESVRIALHQSLCFLPVYVGAYFDKRRTYCTKEYLLFTKIAQERRELLRSIGRDALHLIIPIVYRDEPPTLMRGPIHCNINELVLHKGDPTNNVNCHQELFRLGRSIVEVMAAFDELLAAVRAEKLTECLKHGFPSDEEAIQWLEQNRIGNPPGWRTQLLHCRREVR